jgi:molecular chaperone GrpE
VTDSPREPRSRAEPPVRDSGPVEGVRGNREVPPAPADAPNEPTEPDLEARLASAQAEAETYLKDLQRVAADFDNYRKRAAREQEAMFARAGERVVKELLPVLDDLERALEAAEQHEEAKLEDGVRLVHRQLADVLRKEGLAEIETEGKFDPHVHEALLAQPGGDGVEPGHVLQVLQKGYRLGDRVLRPARVIVAE